MSIETFVCLINYEMQQQQKKQQFFYFYFSTSSNYRQSALFVFVYFCKFGSVHF
jgi:hypothetical protein